MNQSSATTPELHVPSNDEPIVAEIVAEDLIEEVSIDGMCGVY